MSLEVGLAPDSVELAELAATWRSVYVHIPFCARRCPYCDFTVVARDEGATPAVVRRYVGAVSAEVDMEPEWDPLDAVYFGGGTPSRLSPTDLATILASIKDRFGLREQAEISIEANPEDLSRSLAEALVGAGFNRVSLGAQSFDPEVLDSLGRSHSPDRISSAAGEARAAGFTSVSLDLVYGTPGESPASWRATVARAMELAPDHLSAYALTVEPGTELWRAVEGGSPAPDPDDQARKYEHLLEGAPAHGLVRYEVSNFARSGRVCRYSLSTWGQGEYVGLGLAAHGHRDGIRRRNHRQLDHYLTAVEQGERPEAARERVAGRDSEVESLLLGLSRVAGVATGTVGKALVASEEGRRLIAAGVFQERDGRLFVTRPLFTDAVARTVLSLSPGDC